jgi:hypothetical protein
VTAKHIVGIFLGLAAAGVGAWLTVLAPTAQGPTMLLAIGASTVTGILGHAGRDPKNGNGHGPTST